MAGHDCFIAHAAADGAAAHALAAQLAGHRTAFLAGRDVAAGGWDQAIARAQHDAGATVVLLSRASPSAYYLMEEIATAVALHRRGGHRIVPVALEPLAPEQVPYGLLRQQRVEHDGNWERTAQAVVRLLDGPATPARPSAGVACLHGTGPDGRTLVLTLHDGEAATLGRGPDCALRFDDAAISSRHAEVRFAGGELSVRDLGSKNGSLVDGRPVREPRVLRAGDRLRLGPRGPEILVVDAAQPPTATATVADDRL